MNAAPGSAEYYAYQAAQLAGTGGAFGGGAGMGGGGNYMAQEAQRRQVQRQAKMVAKQIQKKHKEIRQISSIPFTTGIVVAVVIGGVMLMFVYYDVLNQNKMQFGILTACLGLFLLVALGRGVREHGAGAIGSVEMVSPA